MTNYLRSIVFIPVFLFSSASINAEPASPENIKKMMQSVGAGEMGIQMMNQMLPVLKKMIPDAPEAFWNDILSEINADEIEDMVIPVYQKYLTENDIQAINQFYQTPAGKKLIQVQPNIMQESMIIGQEWGQNIAKKVLNKYQSELNKKP